jgi:aspartate aminotransferase-like enzyme
MPFVPPEVLLLGPGPSPTSPAVRMAQSLPLLGHLDPAFLPCSKVCSRSAHAVRHAERAHVADRGHRHRRHGALVANLVEPGDRVVVGVHGVFGQRFAEAARRAGGDVVEVRAPFGTPLAPRRLAACDRSRANAPRRRRARRDQHRRVDRPGADRRGRTRAGALFAVDCVTSLGGVVSQFDALGVDAAFSGTQKCLSAPPGLSPVTFSPRALQGAGPSHAGAVLLRYATADRLLRARSRLPLHGADQHALRARRGARRGRRRRHGGARGAASPVAAALRAGLEPLGLEPLVPVPPQRRRC